MRRTLCKCSLALSLGLAASTGWAEEPVWRAVAVTAPAPTPAAAPAAHPVPAPPPAGSAQAVIARSAPPPAPATEQQAASAPGATLERPVSIAQSGAAAPAPAAPVKQVSFDLSREPRSPVIRGTAPETIAIRPMPVGPDSTPAPSLYSWRRAEDVVATTPRQVPLATGVAPPPMMVAPPVAASPTPGVPLPPVTIPGGPFPPPPQGYPPPIVSTAPVLEGPPPGASAFAAGPAGCPTCGGGAPVASGPVMAPLAPADGGCAGCGCGQCGNVDGCYPGHHFYVIGEYLLWAVKGDKTPPLATTGTNMGPGDQNIGALNRSDTQVLFGGNSLGAGARSGGRLTVGYWFGEERCIGLEASGFFLGQDTTHFTRSSMGSPELAIPFFNVFQGVLPGTLQNVSPGETIEGVAGIRTGTIPGVPGVSTLGQLAGTLDIVHRSSLWGAEANLKCGVCCGPNSYVDFLVGYRMLGLDESLSLNESLIVVQNRLDPTTGAVLVPSGTQIMGNDNFNVSNRFYGAQVGFQGEHRWGRWSLGWSSKLGMGPTQQVVTITGQRIENVPGQPVQVHYGNLFTQPTNIGRFSRDKFTVVPESSLNLGYQLTDTLRLFAGYNFLYWSSVARPGAQIDRSVNISQLGANPVLPPVRPAFSWNTSDFWAQGLTLGLEFRY